MNASHIYNARRNSDSVSRIAFWCNFLFAQGCIEPLFSEFPSGFVNLPSCIGEDLAERDALQLFSPGCFCFPHRSSNVTSYRIRLLGAGSWSLLADLGTSKSWFGAFYCLVNLPQVYLVATTRQFVATIWSGHRLDDASSRERLEVLP